MIIYDLQFTIGVEAAEANQKLKIKMQNCGTAARDWFYRTAGGFLGEIVNLSGKNIGKKLDNLGSLSIILCNSVNNITAEINRLYLWRM